MEARDESGIITPEMKQSPLMKRLQITPESPSEIQDLETLPMTDDGQVISYEYTNGPADYEPEIITDYVDDRPKYGPVAPRYGPMVPSGPSIPAELRKKTEEAGVSP